MIKDFNNKLILTSQTPEGFLNLRFELGDLDSYVILTVDTSIEEDVLYINGISAHNYLSASTGYMLNFNADASVASYHFFTKNLYDFEIGFHIDVSSATTLDIYDVSVLNRPFIIGNGNVNTYEMSNLQIEDETSYLVVRTNPKFSGNIKLIIDSSNHLYLDTFKVSEILNNKKYRKQKVSANSVYSSDIRRVFSSMPKGNLHAIDSNTLNISLPKTNINQQYYTPYSYGARLFLDELYEEDYSLLAPLWINSKLPDYFAVFRINGVFNQETYNNLDLANLANKYITSGEIIKSWGIKPNTELGTYLNTHLNEIEIVRSPIFLSLSDPNTKDPDPNTWGGVIIDSGITGKVSETTYAFDKQTNFTDMNAYLSTRFENNNILIPNLINLEYAFSDNDVSLYTMHRYFGLYLSDNELYNISYYSDEEDSSIRVLSLDSNNPSNFFDSSIFLQDGSVAQTYQNRLFTLNDINKIKRIFNVNDINGTDSTFISEWLNKPGELLFSADVEERTTYKFITLKLNNALNQGEHLRIVDKSSFIIWEVLASDSDLLNSGECWPYATYYEDELNTYPTVYRTLFSIKGTKEDQITAIKKAFDVFKDYDDTPFKTTIKKSDQISLEIKAEYNLNDYYFQRLTAHTTDNPGEPNSPFNSAAEYSDINICGVLNPTISDFERLTYDSSYGPINVEIFGDRMSMTVNFINSENYHLFSIDSSYGLNFVKYMMYMSAYARYRLIKPFTLTTTSEYQYNYVIDPHQLKDKIIVKTEYPIYRVQGKWNAYRTYPLTISIMGINPVKDFDFTIYDSSLGFTSEYNYNRTDDISTYQKIVEIGSPVTIDCRNSYKIINGAGTINVGTESKQFVTTPLIPFEFNTFFGNATIDAVSTVTLTHDILDGSSNYSSYVSGTKEEDLNSYYKSTAELKYGLTVPYVTKWVGLGNDCRNNPLRLFLDTSAYDSSTNFIPYLDNFKQEISYPIFKYLSPGTNAWKSYIFYDLNDVLIYEDNKRTTFRQLLINEPYLDVLSKWLYSNKNISSVTTRSSIVYYNDYKNSIDGIINGLNLSFVLDNVASNLFNIIDWDKFRLSFITTPSKNLENNYPIEVFINENTKTILLIWYQGSDNLNYNIRYSTYFGGKSVLSEPSTYNWNSSYVNDDKYWSHVKPPFIVNNASLSSNFINIYGILGMYDSNTCSPFAQLNYNYGDNLVSIFNAYNYNVAASYSLDFYNKQFNTFKQFIDYSYVKNDSTYGASVINIASNYMNNANSYSDNTCNLDTFKYIIGENNINYHIIRGETVYTNSSFAVPPAYITIIEPKKYKDLYTYHGWYKPAFNNILNFNYNEDVELMNIVKKDFILGNTYFASYENIPQLWYNKVVNAISEEDLVIQNAINYSTDFNLFKSQWDRGYYLINDTSTIISEVNGYNASVELPTYFGSKLIKLPDSITLENWDNNTIKYTTLQNEYLIEYNLTRQLVSLFKNNDDFIANWANLTTSDTIINNYIKDTIINYYNLNQGFITVEMWSKDYTGQVLAYGPDSELVQNNAANIKSSLNFINNEYIYKISLNVFPERTYLFKFRLFEK